METFGSPLLHLGAYLPNDYREGVFDLQTQLIRPSQDVMFALGGQAEPVKPVTTLRLPASMADEFAAYLQAADQGLLVKTRTSSLPPSTARAVWEAANGPVPDAFDVDHIVQRQYGGTDELSNLQLKPSGLNRSEGSQAMWLNRPYPYGMVFNRVELKRN